MNTMDFQRRAILSCIIHQKTDASLNPYIKTAPQWQAIMLYYSGFTTPFIGILPVMAKGIYPLTMPLSMTILHAQHRIL